MRRYGNRLLALLLLISSAASAAELMVEGRAPLLGREPAAVRQLAIRDALRNAALHGPLQIESSATMGRDGRPWETLRIGSQLSIEDVEVVAEWQDGGMLFVRIRVQPQSDAEGCRSKLHKSVVVTGFPLLRYEFPELAHMVSELPRELLLLLQADRGYHGRDRSDRELFEHPHRAPDSLLQGSNGGSIITELANDEQAQFVISGVIDHLWIDAWPEGNDRRSLWRPSSWLADDGPILRAALRIYLFDGISGRLLNQFVYREQQQLSGDLNRTTLYDPLPNRQIREVVMPTLHQILQQARSDIHRTIACQPFTARVIGISGSDIYLDAGANSGLVAGDELTLFTRRPAAVGLGGENIGMEPTTTVTIQGVFPQSVMARPAAATELLDIRIGDIARQW